MRGVPRTLLLALGLALVSALPAAAAPSWSSSTSLSTPGAAVTGPSVAINDGGLGIEAWAEMSAGHSVIRAAQHTAGSPWVSSPGSLSGALPGDACQPFTSIDPAGNALVVWRQWAGPGCFNGNQTILYSTRASGAPAWSAPQPIGATAASGPGEPTADVNAAGQMVVTWTTTAGSFDDLFASVGSPTGGFGATPMLTQVPSTDALYYLTTAIGPNGDAAVQWEHYSSVLGVGNIEASVRPRGGAFQAMPTSLTMNVSPSSSSNGALAIDDAGDVFSAYSENDGTNESFVSQLRPVTNGVWRPAQPIVTPLAPFTDAWIDIGVDAGGNATVVWLETNFHVTPDTHRLWSATRVAGLTSTWVSQPALTEVLPGQYAPPRLAVARSGAAAVAWEDIAVANSTQALYRPAGGAFGPLTPIGAGTGENISLAPSGDAAFSFIGDGNDARVAVLDATPPALGPVAVPATATTGQAVAMSASAVDAWSPLAAGQPAWSFGDGASGTGASVSHAFAAPGTYTVTVGASDGLGNVAAPVTRQIAISNPPVPPLPQTTVTKPTSKIIWKAGKLSNSSITLHGTVGGPASLTITVIAHATRKTVARSIFAATAGAWSRTIKLPTSLAPGAYDVTVGGPVVLSSQTSFTLSAPVTGIVKRTYATGPRRGPAVTTLAHTSELWAHFQFSFVPKKGQKITTQWILPNGRKLAANTRPRTGLVEAQVKDLSGKALAAGRWRCVVTVGKVVLATLNVRVK